MVPTNSWQRVSPVAVVYFFLRTIPQLTNYWPVFVGVLAAGETVRYFALVYGVPALVILIVLIAGLQYFFFRFHVEADRIQIQSGVLNKTRLTLDFERVQQADIIKPFYFRPLQLTTLSLESAGSTQQEVDLPGVPLAVAEQLRARILEQSRTPEAQAAAESQSAEAQYELTLPPSEVARYGLMHNALLFLAPLAAPLGQYIGPAIEYWTERLEGWPGMQQWEAAESAWAIITLTTVAVLLGVAFLFAISTLLALVYYWGYRLVRTGDRFQAQFGLGTQRTRGFRLQKLQKVIITQGMVARLLRRFTLSISKAGSVKPSTSNDGRRFVIPVLGERKLAELKEQLALPSPQWTRIHPFYIFDKTRSTGTLLFLIGGATLFMSQWPFWQAIAWALLSYPLVALIAWRRWNKMGYFFDREWLVLRQGFIGHKEQWLPSGKLQKLAINETPLLRWMGLAHLDVWNTDGPMTLGYLPKPLAERLRVELLTDMVRYRKPWF